MPIHIIAAISNENQIGYKNELLCRLPNDLKRFKQLTENNIVVMGYNTYKSLGRSLPNRINVVLTRKKEHDLPSDVFVYDSLESILHEYNNYANKEIDIWIIGGEQTYAQFMPHADFLHLTIIDTVFPQADTHFPKFTLDHWKPIGITENKADDKHDFDFYYVTYRKIV